MTMPTHTHTPKKKKGKKSCKYAQKNTLNVELLTTDLKYFYSWKCIIEICIFLAAIPGIVCDVINKSNGKFEMSKKYVLMGMVSPLDPHSIIVTVKFVWCSYPVLISLW